MPKTYVLDTSTLLRSPDALYAFEDNDIVIPCRVLHDLVRLSKGVHGDLSSETALHARTVLSELTALHAGGDGLVNGVPLGDEGGTLRVYVNTDFKGDYDDVMLACCKALQDQKRSNSDDSPTILVTNDLPLSVRAAHAHFPAQSFRADDAGEDGYTGHEQLFADHLDFDRFAEIGVVDVDKLYKINNETGDKVPLDVVDPHLFVTLADASDPKCTLLGRVDANASALTKLHFPGERPFDVKPRNAMQRFIIDALMDPVSTLPLVVIKGPAGTAKTFLSLAVGLERVYNGTGADTFKCILACRPNVMLDGDEHGFLPGTEQEKIQPLMRPVWDNLAALLDSNKKSSASELTDKIQELIDRRVIDTQAVGYLRGRSIERTWIIVDEAQNLGPATARALISRAGEGSKIILCGDPQQVDSPYLTASANAISSAAAHMRSSALAAVITTNESDVVRSPLARDAVKHFGM